MKTNKLLLLGIIALTVFSFTIPGNHSPAKRNFHTAPDGNIYIVIIKSTYELKVYDEEGWYATYPVVFGSKSLEDKMVEGDRKTPEGTFRIVSKRPHEKWDKMMLIDYPTKADYEKFNARKSRGLIPAGAKIGGGIGIHGTWPHDENAVDAFQNWTNGCISLKREDMDELYELIPVGTRVTIQR